MELQVWAYCGYMSVLFSGHLEGICCNMVEALFAVLLLILSLLLAPWIFIGFGWIFGHFMRYIAWVFSHGPQDPYPE